VLYESGIENVVLTIQKNIRFHNSRGLELKIEDFNALKHDQFYRRLPAVDGQIGASAFAISKVLRSLRLTEFVAKYISKG